MYSRVLFLHFNIRFFFSLDRRRLAGSAVGPSISAAVQPAKKPKLTSAVLSRTDTFVPTTTVQDVGKSWEQAAIDIEAIDLVPTIEAAKDKDENEKIVNIIFNFPFGKICEYLKIFFVFRWRYYAEL